MKKPQPLSKEYLLNRGYCCNNGCTNCPYKMKNQVENKSDKISSETTYDIISTHRLIEFLEYEEGLTKDRESAKRIRTLLTNLGIWKK